MILTEEVQVSWNAKTCSYYIQKGYGPFKKGQFVNVKVADLSNGSHALIYVKCDYCGKKKDKPIEYKEYYTSTICHITGKYACKKCSGKKREEVIVLKNNLGILSKKDKGYYKIRENRMMALEEYIRENKGIDGIWNSKVYNYFHSHNDDLMEAIKELGYDHQELRTETPKFYWHEFEKIKNAVEEFISLYKRFPKQSEMLYEIGISLSAIKIFGGVIAIKKRMKYKRDDELIDDKGDYNRSTYELIVANFLYYNGISYNREQTIKKGNLFRSDFLFSPKTSSVKHVEVWGYPKSENRESIGWSYNEKRERKEKFYMENNIAYISIEQEIFKQSYKKIEESLREIFKPYLKQELNQVEQERLIPANKLSDSELLKVVMMYSGKKKRFPPSKLIEEKAHGVYKEILKRYGSFREWAESIGYEANQAGHNFWNDSRIIERLAMAIKEHNGLPNNAKDLRRYKEGPYKGLSSAIDDHRGWRYYRLHALKYLIEKNKKLPEKEVNYLRHGKVRGELPKDTPLEEIIEYALKKLDLAN